MGLLAGVLVAKALAADDGVAAAIRDFEVPSFSSRQLLLEGEDLLAVKGTADGVEADANLALTFTLTSQRPTRTVIVGNRLAGYATTQTRYPLALAGEEVAVASLQQYVAGPRGPYVSLAGGAGAAAVADKPALADAFASVGAGWGRIVDARTVAQAATMFRALERDPTPADLARVADVIGQRGAYALKYTYDADMYFYGDLAEALGGADPAQTFLVQQVLESPLYNIGSRFVGWEAGVRADVGAGDLASDASGATVVAHGYGRAATVIGDRASVLVSADLAFAAVDEASQALTTPVGGIGSGNGEMTLYAGLTVDHSSSWMSKLTVTTVPLVIAAGDPEAAPSARWSATAETDLSVQKRLVLGMGLEASQTFGAADLAWSGAVTLALVIL